MQSFSPELAPAESLAAPPPKEKSWRAGTLTYTTGGLVLLFVWLLWGDFAWSLKERSVPSIVQLLFKKYQASDTMTGFLMGSLPGLLAMVLCPVVSYKSDRYRGRWGRRIPFLLIPTPFAVIAMAGLAYSPELGTRLSQWVGPGVIGRAPAILACFGFFWTVFEFCAITANSVFGALVNDVVPRPVLGRFYGMFRALSLLAGMLFNFWLLGKAEAYYKWIFLGGAALYGVGFTVMCLRVKEGQYPPPERSETSALEPVGLIQATRSYFIECFGNSYFVLFFVAMALSWMAFMPINLFSLFFAKSIGMSMDAFGKCLAATYFFSFAFSYVVGSMADRFHPLRVGLVAQVLYLAITLVGGLVIRNVWALGVFFVLHGVLSGTWMTATASISQRILPQEKFAQLGSAAALVGSLCSIAIGPLMGGVLDYTGHDYRYTYFASAFLTLLAVITSLIVYRKFLELGGPDHYVAPIP